YAFRGAVNDSMERLRSLKDQWVDLPLYVTFRCPKVVVRKQQHHAPGFRAADGNAEGQLLRLPEPIRNFSIEDDRIADPNWAPKWQWSELLGKLPSQSGSIA